MFFGRLSQQNMSTLEGGDAVEGFSIVSHDLDAPVHHRQEGQGIAPSLEDDPSCLATALRPVASARILLFHCSSA